MDGGAWWATVHGVSKSQTCLSTRACTQEAFTCDIILALCKLVERLKLKTFKSHTDVEEYRNRN